MRRVALGCSSWREEEARLQGFERKHSLARLALNERRVRKEKAEREEREAFVARMRAVQQAHELEAEQLRLESEGDALADMLIGPGAVALAIKATRMRAVTEAVRDWARS